MQVSVKTSNGTLTVTEHAGIASVQCWGFPDVINAISELTKAGYTLLNSTDAALYPFSRGSHFGFFMECPKDGTSITDEVIKAPEAEPEAETNDAQAALENIPTITAETPKKGPAKKGPAKKAN